MTGEHYTHTHTSCCVQVSMVRDVREREIRIFTDAGRICRPLLIVENQKLLLKRHHVDMLKERDVNNSRCVCVRVCGVCVCVCVCVVCVCVCVCSHTSVCIVMVPGVECRSVICSDTPTPTPTPPPVPQLAGLGGRWPGGVH